MRPGSRPVAAVSEDSHPISGAFGFGSNMPIVIITPVSTHSIRVIALRTLSLSDIVT